MFCPFGWNFSRIIFAEIKGARYPPIQLIFVGIFSPKQGIYITRTLLIILDHITFPGLQLLLVHSTQDLVVKLLLLKKEFWNNSIRYAVKRKKRYYLGIFPNMGGGGLPKSQNFCKFTKYFFVCQIHSEVLKHVLQRWGGDIWSICTLYHHSKILTYYRHDPI